ncbi:glycosyltransferase [Betaproteobacteria bacterium LSUCC0115]|nr:glycosyltransferase [Burkholderiales bacterium LSUCC0115]
MNSSLLSFVVPTVRDPARIAGQILRNFECLEDQIEIVIIFDGRKIDFSSRIDPSLLGQGVKIEYSGVRGGAGPGAARNIGLEVSTGRYVTFVDDDDDIGVDAYKLLDLLRTKDHSLLVGEFSHPTPSFERRHSNRCERVTVEEYVRRIISTESCLNHCTGLIINRRWLNVARMRFVDTRVVEDLMFSTELLSKLEDLNLTNLFRYGYKFHPQSTKNINSASAVIDVIRVKQALQDLDTHLRTDTNIKRYVQDRVEYLETLALSRLPAFVTTNPRDRLGNVKTMTRLMFTLFKTKVSLCQVVSLLLSLSALMGRLSRSLRRMQSTLIEPLPTIAIYCSGALSEVLRSYLLKIGNEKIYVIDDNFSEINGNVTLGQFFEICESNRNHRIYILIANINKPVIKKITERVLNIFPADDFSVEIQSLPAIFHENRRA